MAVPPLLRDLGGRALDLLYPERCVSCGRFGTLVCAPCTAALAPATGPGRCPNCAAAWADPNNCPRCITWNAIDGASAAYEMRGTARRIVHGLKYRRARGLAPLMAASMAPLREARAFDAAYAVPLHVSRLRDRGFNQSQLLLDALAWPAGPGTLRRRRKTATQVGQHLTERRRNVSEAFTFEGPSLAGMTVALVDDVITTGATVNECARVLRDHGARHVVAIAYARANYDPSAPAPLD